MFGRNELFSSLDDSIKLLLKFGNSTKIPIEGKGNIPVRLKDGSLSYISDVFYAPELDYNLLSMGQLSEKGYKMITYHGYCTVFDNNRRFIDKAKMTSNRMFSLKIQHVNPSCMSSVILDDNWLWHMRFGHFHFSGLNYLSRKGLVSGLPRIHIPNCVCEICQLGKKHRDPFPTGKSWRARRLLEIVHSDLCSVEVSSNGGSRCPTKSVRDKTPEEAWSGKRPSIHHFRVFGCIAYAHIITEFREAMIKHFEMTDMGLMSYFLGIEVVQRDDGIFISQKKYANDILKKFQMEHSKPVSTPVEEKFKLLREDKGGAVNHTYYKSLIGSLRYLTATRPDIVFGVGLLSRFMEEPCTNHLQAAKRILRYIKGTLNDGIYYENTNEVNLVGYTDSDWAGDIETRKSTSGFVFHLGFGAISWSSKKQPVVALSTAEVEYIAAASCATQVVSLRRILEELNEKQNTPTTIFCDNKSAIALCKNPVFMEDRSILIFDFTKSESW
ncbi:uncharacterized protein [Arachis hypogaea]|uniref:uncharacterized protein n=1 Tax=Arachis hypogaea TaxID=3818 RepID=UPI003B2168E6